MNHKIKIALFSDVLKEGIDGVTHTLFNIIRYIPKDRFSFVFVTPYPPDDIASFEYPIYVCRYFRFPLYREYRVANPGNDKDLERFLDTFQPDLVHITTPSLLGQYASKYSRKRNIPFTSIYHTHFISYIDYYFRFFPFLVPVVKLIVKRIMQRFYNKCDMIFIPSTPIRDEVIAMGIDAERLTIWGRGIDIDMFNPGRRDLQYIQSISRYKQTRITRILFVGRIVWEKNIRILSELYRIFKEKNKRVEFIITGSGPKRAALKKMMPDAVFTGPLYNEQLARIYASSDIFLFPSTTETFGNVVLEAMASGVPVVVSSKGGPAGFVIDGETGFIAEANNTMDFYSKLDRLLSNENLYKTMQKNCIAYAKSQTWEQLTMQLFDSYQSVVSDSGQKKIEELNEITT